MKTAYTVGYPGGVRYWLRWALCSTFYWHEPVGFRGPNGLETAECRCGRYGWI